MIDRQWAFFIAGNTTVFETGAKRPPLGCSEVATRLCCRLLACAALCSVCSFYIPHLIALFTSPAAATLANLLGVITLPLARVGAVTIAVVCSPLTRFFVQFFLVLLNICLMPFQ